VSLTASVGDLTVVTQGSLRPVVAPVLGVLGVDGASQGTTGVEVVGAGPQLGDDIGSLLWDLVVRGADAGVPVSVAPGDAAIALESSSAAGLGVSRLYQLGSPSSSHPTINWRRV
jgi:hypothetical protein